MKPNQSKSAILIASAGDYGGVATHLNHFYSALASIVKIQKTLLFFPGDSKSLEKTFRGGIEKYDSLYPIYKWIPLLKRSRFFVNFISEIILGLSTLRRVSRDYVIISSHDPLAFWGFSLFAKKIDYYIFVLPSNDEPTKAKISVSRINKFLLRFFIGIINKTRDVRYFVQTQEGLEVWSRTIQIEKKAMTVLPNPPYIVCENYSLINDDQPNSEALDDILSKVRSGARLVLSIGHLVDYKNPATWAQCALRATESDQDYVFVWVGSGVLFEEISKIISGHVNIYLLGRLNQKDIRVLYSNTWIFLHPAFVESQGIVIFDALACGIPVILNDTQVLRGLIEGKDVGYSIDFTKSDSIPQFLEILEDFKRSNTRQIFSKNATKVFGGGQLYDDWKEALRQRYIVTSESEGFRG